MSDPERVNAEPEILEAESKASAILKKVLKVAAKIPFASHVVAMVYALRDPAVPIQKKAIIAGALLYFLSPLDLIPDFMAGIGYTDDAAVIMAALATVQNVMTPEHYQRAEEFLASMGKG